MIVVVGAPSIRPDPETGRGEPAGLAARIALATAAAGASVQLAGKVGDDPAGDEVLLGLARAGVRHDAVLRDPDRATPLAELEEVPGSEGAPSVGAAKSADTSAELGLGAAGASAAPALDAADIELCLSYLREFAVIVAAEPLDPAGLVALGAAATFAGAGLVVIVPPGGIVVGLPSGATILEGPREDPDDDFARLVARFSVALERGADPGEAFRLALAGGAWESVRDY